MSLLHPGWLMLLLILPLILLGAVLTHRGRNRAWQQMVAPRLREQLVVIGSPIRRWCSLALGLAGCALVIIVIARPHHGETTLTEQIRARNILIAIDTSRSMLAQDVSPDRIGSAKAMALELKNAFPHDRIGVIAFSGAPVLMAPLTIDHTAIHETISQLDTNVIPSGGSDLAAAVQLAIKTFRKSGHKSNALVIISDGEDHSEKIQLAGSEVRDAGIAVCTIGVGTTEGGMIPDLRSSDGMFHDINGRTVHSRLNPDSLGQLARAGRGSYVPASSGADNAIRQALSFLESDQESGRQISIPRESYQWFLLPAIILLALSLIIRSNLLARRVIRPATALATTGILFLSGQQLEAATDIQSANAAYERKDYAEALELYGKALANAREADRHAIEFSQGSSAYRLQKWDIASRYFSRSLLTNDGKLQEQSHYNLGNALFQSGWSTLNLPESPETQNPFLDLMRGLFSKPATRQPEPKQSELTQADVQRVKTYWQDAVTHYRNSLGINPENADARHNLKEVEKLLQQLREAEQQAKKEREEQNSEQSKQDRQDQSEQQQNNQDRGGQPKEESDKDGDPDKNGKQEDQDGQQQGDTTEHPEEEPEESQPADRQPDESEEAFAARILKELSDAETRPVNRRFIRLRRPAKDW